MSKFKKGDRVRADGNYLGTFIGIGSNGSPLIRRDDRMGWHTNETVARDALLIGAEPGDGYWWVTGRIELVEPATPTEHPALTLAKAEVVRIRAQNGISWSEGVRLNAFLEVLRAFGLEYRAKPVVPQPVEYEFVPVQDAG